MILEVELTQRPDGIEWRTVVGGRTVAGGVLHITVVRDAWHQALDLALDQSEEPPLHAV
jgi:hypothetical protein